MGFPKTEDHGRCLPCLQCPFYGLTAFVSIKNPYFIGGDSIPISPFHREARRMVAYLHEFAQKVQPVYIHQ